METRLTEKPRGRRRVTVVLALALLSVGVIGLVAGPLRPADAPSPASPGSAARGCGGPPLAEGGRIPLPCRVEEIGGAGWRTVGEIQAGKPLVLNFWATWCPFCIKEMPDFQRVYEQMGGRVQFLGLDLVGVQGETRRAAAEFARQTGVRYPLAFDEGGELYFRVSPRVLMPTTLLVRPDGTIAYRQFGPLTAEALRGLIGEHLGTV